MPLLENYYDGPPYLFLPAHVDPRSKATISKSGDVVTIQGTIVVGGTVPIDDTFFSGATLEAGYVPAEVVNADGVLDPGPHPMRVKILGTDIYIGSLDEFFSIFPETVKVNFSYIAALPEVVAPIIPLGSGQAGGPGLSGVVRVGR